MMEEINIRKAEVEDIDNNLLDLFIQGYNFHLKSRPDKFSVRTNERLRQILVESMKSDNFVVAEKENKIVGYASYKIDEKNSHKALWVDQLVIDDNFQGKGFGKAIMNELEKTAKKEGCRFVELSCWEFNKKANEIYKHLGYYVQRVTYEKKLTTD